MLSFKQFIFENSRGKSTRVKMIAISFLTRIRALENEIKNETDAVKQNTLIAKQNTLLAYINGLDIATNTKEKGLMRAVQSAARQ